MTGPACSDSPEYCVLRGSVVQLFFLSFFFPYSINWTHLKRRSNDLLSCRKEDGGEHMQFLRFRFCSCCYFWFHTVCASNTYILSRKRCSLPTTVCTFKPMFHLEQYSVTMGSFHENIVTTCLLFLLLTELRLKWKKKAINKCVCVCVHALVWIYLYYQTLEHIFTRMLYY